MIADEEKNMVICRAVRTSVNPWENSTSCSLVLQSVLVSVTLASPARVFRPSGLEVLRLGKVPALPDQASMGSDIALRF